MHRNVHLGRRGCFSRSLCDNRYFRSLCYNRIWRRGNILRRFRGFKLRRNGLCYWLNWRRSDFSFGWRVYFNGYLNGNGFGRGGSRLRRFRSFNLCMNWLGYRRNRRSSDFSFGRSNNGSGRWRLHANFSCYISCCRSGWRRRRFCGCLRSRRRRTGQSDRFR